MFFKSMFKIFNNSYDTLYNNDFNKIDEGLIRFFRTEYGSDWKNALEHHLYKESIKNDKVKKAA